MRMATKLFMKLNTIQSPSSSPPPDDNNIFTQILIQLNEWLALLPNLIHSLITKFNDAFPPETRPHWLAVLPPWAIAALGVVLLFICFWCLSTIISYIGWVVCACWKCVMGLLKMVWHICKKVFCCGGKMMKAPGKGGELMLRSVFEAAPQAYFAALRAGSYLV